MLTAMIVNRRPEAEFMFVAPTMEIAAIAYKQAKGTIRLDSELSKLFHVQDHIRKITHRRSGATLADQGRRHRHHYRVESDWDHDR